MSAPFVSIIHHHTQMLLLSKTNPTYPQTSTRMTNPFTWCCAKPNPSTVTSSTTESELPIWVWNKLGHRQSIIAGCKRKTLRLRKTLSTSNTKHINHSNFHLPARSKHTHRSLKQQVKSVQWLDSLSFQMFDCSLSQAFQDTPAANSTHNIQTCSTTVILIMLLPYENERGHRPTYWCDRVYQKNVLNAVHIWCSEYQLNKNCVSCELMSWD